MKCKTEPIIGVDFMMDMVTDKITVYSAFNFRSKRSIRERRGKNIFSRTFAEIFAIVRDLG